MVEVDLRAGLRSLRESLRQIKSLLAWEQLKRSESTPNQPPAFQISDPTESDLKNEYSFFLSTLVQVHNILNDGTLVLPDKYRQSIQRQIYRIEQQANHLNLHQRFYMC